MQFFFDNISKFVTLSEKTKDAFSQIITSLQLPKGRTLVQPNTVCEQLYFIEKGLTRTYYFKDDRDITDWISTEGDFAGSMISFLTRQPDRRGVELLEDSLLYAIPYSGLEKLYARYHEMEHLGRILTNFGFIQIQQRFDDLHFASALERYTKLMQTKPTIIQRAPLHIVASYLGMSQETLSRIRSQV